MNPSSKVENVQKCVSSKIAIKLSEAFLKQISKDKIVTKILLIYIKLILRKIHISRQLEFQKNLVNFFFFLLFRNTYNARTAATQVGTARFVGTLSEYAIFIILHMLPS